MDVVYLCIKNWDKYQEKRTNANGETWRPPWVKLYVDSSRDYAYSKLTMRERGLLTEMYKLAGRLENQIPNDPQWIARAIQTNEEIKDELNVLIKSGFVQGNMTHSVIVTETFGQNDGSKKSRGEESKEANASSSKTREVYKVYNHWRERRGKTHGRYLRMSAARSQKITARLKEFSAAELKRAIDGVALDPWEERARHDDLTVIFRSQEQVEKFLALADDPSLLPAEERRRRHLERLAEEGR